jgi:hypothetical protein
MFTHISYKPIPYNIHTHTHTYIYIYIYIYSDMYAYIMPRSVLQARMPPTLRMNSTRTPLAIRLLLPLLSLLTLVLIPIYIRATRVRKYLVCNTRMMKNAKRVTLVLQLHSLSLPIPPLWRQHPSQLSPPPQAQHPRQLDPRPQIQHPRHRPASLDLKPSSSVREL